jgi:hypothetical protein
MRRCRARVVCVSAGMAEIGGEGLKRQQRMTAIARETGMRIVGPNCLGVFDVAHKFYATFAAGPSIRSGFHAGRCRSSQSGAFGMHASTRSPSSALCTSWLTTGNEVTSSSAAFRIWRTTSRPGDPRLSGRRRTRTSSKDSRRRAKGKPVIVIGLGAPRSAPRRPRRTGSLVGSDAATRHFDSTAPIARTISEPMTLRCNAGRYPIGPEIGTIHPRGANVIMAYWRAIGM